MRRPFAWMILALSLSACGSSTSSSSAPVDAGAPGDATDGDADATGCVPRTCEQQGAVCGALGDGCGRLLDCGSCEAPASCGGGGVANQCGCTPRTCEDVGADCDALDDGCGDTVSCGKCAAPDTCGGGNTPNVCAHALWEDGWCLASPYPHANDFYGVASAPGLTFALGDMGTALARTTGGWATVPSYTRIPSYLHDYLSTGSRDGWAVGENGALLRFDGDILMCNDSEQEYWSPVKTDLFAIVQDQQGTLWTVGEGAILRFDGQFWTVAQSFQGVLQDVVAASDGTLWAVGSREKAGALSPLVMRYDGAWTEQPLGDVDCALEAIAIAEDDAFISVGVKVSGQPCVVRGQGTQWSEIAIGGPSSGAFTLRSVAGSGSDLWAVGDDGGMVHVRGGHAERVAPVLGEGDLRGLERTDRGLLLAGQDGLLAEYHHGFWHPSIGRVPAGADPTLPSCAFRTHDVWVGGDGWILRWNGLRWTVATVPMQVVGFYAVSPRNVWVGGNRGEGNAVEGVVMHYDGETWREAHDEAGRRISAVEGTSSTDVRVRLEDGAWLHFDGATWQERQEQDFPVAGTTGCASAHAWTIDEQRGFVRQQGGEETATRLWPFDGLQRPPHDAWAASDTEVWATGADGIVHGTEAGWSKLLEGIEVRAVRGRSPQDVWFAGSGAGGSGPVWHWDGTALTAASAAPEEAELYAISVTAEGDVFCAGEQLHRWNGDGWEAQTVPGTGAIRALWAWSPTDIWAGRGTSVLHYDGMDWEVLDAYEKLDLHPINDQTTMEVERIFGITPDEMLYVGRSPDDSAAILLARKGDEWGNGVLQQVAGDATFNAVWARGLDDVYVIMGQIGWVYHYRFSVRMFDSVEGVLAEPLWALTGFGQNRWAFGEGGIVAHAGP